MNEFLAAIGTGFWPVLWMLCGLVAGAIIQFGLNKFSQREFRSNALQLFKTELEINIDECHRFEEQLRYLESRISAGQINEQDLFVSMQGFDYSAIAPLVNNGFLHLILGPFNTQCYFNFMRTYNNNVANWVNAELRTEHARGKSLDFIAKLMTQLAKDRRILERLRDAEIINGRLVSLKQET